MKRLITFSLFCSLSVPAMAQSSVTLFGVISDGVNFTSNDAGKHAYQMTSGGIQGTRIGLKGTEDLGGGLTANFFLADVFDNNSGKLAQGLIWGRLAYVGLDSKNFGSVRLGRQYDSVVDYVAPLTANGSWGGFLLAHPYDNDNTDTSNRANNTIRYQSPDIAGVRFGGTYSFSNATEFANNRETSVGGSYHHNGLSLGVAYLDADNPGNGSTGALTNTDSIFVAKHMDILGAGMNYAFGRALIGLVYTRTQLKDPVSSIYAGPLTLASGAPLDSLNFENFEISGSYQVTPALYVGAQYVFTQSSVASAEGKKSPDYHTAGFSIDYFLSKQTDVCLQGAYVKVDGDVSGTILDRAYVPESAGASSKTYQYVTRIGFRHQF